MESGGPAYVLHVQGQSVFQAVDTFMFCPMVLEKPPDILHHGDGQDIAHKNTDPEQALDHRCQKVILNKTGEQGGNHIRKHKEKADGYYEGNDCHYAFYDLIHLFRPGRLFGGPFLPCLLFLLFIKRCRVGGDPHPQDQGIQKHEDASHKGRLFQDRTLQDPVIGFLTDRHRLVGLADGDRIVVPAAHHNAFQNGLTADAGVMLFTLFFCH